MASDRRAPSVRVVIAPRLDDRPGWRIAGHLEIGELEMMGAAIDAGDDRIGGALQLVVQAALDQPAEHRIGWLLAVQSEAADVRLVPAGAHRLVHGLDDVAPDAELAQRLVRGPASASSRPARPAPRGRGVRASPPARAAAGAVRGPRRRAPGRRSATPPHSSEMSRSARSRLVQRSASTSFSSAVRISCSLRGPSSRVTRSAARSRKPRLMYSRLMTRSWPSSARPRIRTWMWGLSVFQ